MKTKELIRQLMEADPSGEEECCVGNVDIHYVCKDPAYYDGSLQVLLRDETEKQYYNIIGGKYVRTGYKIQIHTLAISDIMDDPDVIMDYSLIGDEAIAQKYKESDQKTLEAHKRIKIDCEWSLFERWAKERAAQIAGDPLDLNAARYFFDKNIDPSAPLPTEKTQDELDGKCVHDSYNNRRRLQWDKTIEISFSGMDWHFTKKEQ